MKKRNALLILALTAGCSNEAAKVAPVTTTEAPPTSIYQPVADDPCILLMRHDYPIDWDYARDEYGPIDYRHGEVVVIETGEVMGYGRTEDSDIWNGAHCVDW